MARGIDRSSLRGVLHLHALINAHAKIDDAYDGYDQHRRDHAKLQRRAAVSLAGEPTDIAGKASQDHCTILGEFEPIGLVLYWLQSTARFELPVNTNVSPISWVQVDPLVEPPA